MSETQAKQARKTARIQARVREQDKKNAEDILNHLGLTLSQGVELFIRQVIQERGLPFELKLPAKNIQYASSDEVMKINESLMEEYGPALRKLAE